MVTKDRIKFWEDTTGTLIVYDPNHDDCGTAHRPDKGKDAYNKTS